MSIMWLSRNLQCNTSAIQLVELNIIEFLKGSEVMKPTYNRWDVIRKFKKQAPYPRGDHTSFKLEYWDHPIRRTPKHWNCKLQHNTIVLLCWTILRDRKYAIPKRKFLEPSHGTNNDDVVVKYKKKSPKQQDYKCCSFRLIESVHRR